MKRIEDEKFSLKAEISTNSFDSALFQRGLYERNSVIETVMFEDVSLKRDEGDTEVGSSGVSFKAELQVPLGAVPYVPNSEVIPVTDQTVLQIGTSTDESTGEDELSGNQAGL